jgi:hypothetical protein
MLLCGGLLLPAVVSVPWVSIIDGVPSVVDIPDMAGVPSDISTHAVVSGLLLLRSFCYYILLLPLLLVSILLLVSLLGLACLPFLAVILLFVLKIVSFTQVTFATSGNDTGGKIASLLLPVVICHRNQ